jgi:pyridoxal phosphate enzyme (YggS family)
VLDPAALRARLADVRARIARAADRAGRDPASIRLVAVSKTFSADHVRALAEAGQIDFGENKVQEAIPKIELTAPLGLRWHLIGHLQSNKVRRAAGVFDVVHSIDAVAILDRLNDAARQAGREIDALVQVDLAREPTKHGAPVDALEPLFARAGGLDRVHLIGLMLLPPASDDPERARPYFRELRQLRDRLAATGVAAPLLAELSMGMSHDFEAAVEEGATLVRVGTAIFGSR